MSSLMVTSKLERQSFSISKMKEIVLEFSGRKCTEY